VTYFESYGSDIDLSHMTAPEVDAMEKTLWVHYNEASDQHWVEAAQHDIRTLNQAIGQIASGEYQP
jgi:hypothetical protein